MYEIHRIDAIEGVERLPYTLRILLENVLRTASDTDVEAIANWVAEDEPHLEINCSPGRAIHQDFTGVPAIVDLAAMRNAMADMADDAAKINPLIPAELVIDHSVQVDEFASRLAIERNVELEFERNFERYAFLRWGQGAFDNFKVVPPNTGIVHQVNLEYLAGVVDVRDGVAFRHARRHRLAHDDEHGLGVLGWGAANRGRGGNARRAAVDARPAGRRFAERSLPEGSTATDLVLTVTELLRKTGALASSSSTTAGACVAPGRRPRDDRQRIASTARRGFFRWTTRRSPKLTGGATRIALVRPTARENLLWHDPAVHPTYSQIVELDLASVEPSLAGPRRPQDRVPLARAKESFIEALGTFGVPYPNSSYDKEVADTFPASDPTTGDATSDQDPVRVAVAEHEPRHVRVGDYELTDGSVVIAAITSCTIHVEPTGDGRAGLLAKKAIQGLKASRG